MIVNIPAQPLAPDYHIPALDRRYREFCQPLSAPCNTQVKGFERANKEFNLLRTALPLMFAAGFFMGIATMLFLQA